MLTFSYDKQTDVFTVEGMKFSGQLMRAFAKDLAVGTLFRLVRREGDVIWLERVAEGRS